jgi:hypothetical protein
MVCTPVFRVSIPYDQIAISDGLGYDNREFTVPTSIWIPGFNVDIGKYVIHAGDGYQGLEKDPRTLIHELTHVWQEVHSRKGWHVLARSLGAQAVYGFSGDDAYSYDHKNYLDWDEYNPEQQASIIEHSFMAGAKMTREEDIRFYYVKKYIWREDPGSDWIHWVNVQPLDHATLSVTLSPTNIDALLLPILQKRFAADDVQGYGGRANQLHQLFRKVDGDVIRGLLPRLERRKPGDKVSEAFYDILSAELRMSLLADLRRR